MNRKIKICTVDELPKSGSKGFSLMNGNWPLEIFMINQDGQYLSYLNQCPHTGVGLEWKPDEFLDSRGEFIQCSTHGARFRIEDGYCVYGPCAGQSLKPLKLDIENGEVHLLLDEDQ